MFVGIADDYTIFAAKMLLHLASNRLRRGSSDVEAHVLRRQKVDRGDLLELLVTVVVDRLGCLLGEDLLINLYTVGCERRMIKFFDRGRGCEGLSVRLLHARANGVNGVISVGLVGSRSKGIVIICHRNR